MAEQPEHTPIDLSIIIPVYNTLPYFRKYIESITSQELGQYTLEVILIDGNSTDGSSEYCDEVANQCSYIQAIHIENSGTPARPRNIGIEEAHGHYVFFCDSDDYFEKDTLVSMLDHAFEDKCDIGLFRIKGEGRDSPKVFDDNKIWKQCTVSNCKETNPLFLRTYTVIKLFSHQFIETYHIRFSENVAFEDFSFALECYFNASNICIYSDRIYYHNVRRDDGSSLEEEGDSAWFYAKPETLLTGLENYLAVASRYCLPDDYPDVYRVGLLSPIIRILSKLEGTGEFERQALSRLRASFQLCKNSEPLRQTLGLRTLMLFDALFLCDDKSLMKVFNSWPCGLDIEFPSLPDGTINYVIRSVEDDHMLLQAPLPLIPDQKDQLIQNPSLLKNRIMHFQSTPDAIEMSGHAQIVHRCEKEEFAAKLRINFLDGTDGKYDRWIDVKLENTSSVRVYSSVYQIEFDWNAHCLFEDLVPADSTETVRIYFYLDVELDTGKTLTNRLGSNRVDGIASCFLSQAVYHSDHLFTPYETSYKNLCLYARSNTQPVKTANVEFLKHDGDWCLDTQGSLSFDNYASTQIELVVSDSDGKEILSLPLEKGEDIKDRKFKGSFKFDDLDESLRKKASNFELKVAITNKTVCFKVADIKVTPAFGNRITQLQTTSEAIQFEGCAQLAHRSGQKEFAVKLRALFHGSGHDRLFDNVTVQKTVSTHVYGATYVAEFNWRANCPFEELVPADYIDPSRICFFLDAEFDSGESKSDRLGHDRTDEVYPSFISQVIWHSDHLFAPYETKYKNFSLNVY